MRSKYKWEWYWIWWLVVEKLSEATNFKLLLTNKWVISNLYLANMEVIEYLFEIWLLIEDWTYFWSPSLLYRMELKSWVKKAQSEWGKEAMRKRRWNADSYKSLITSKVKEKKVKEIKEKEKENTNTSVLVEQAPESYGDPDINSLIEKIKVYNNGICDWTVKEQRQYGKQLLTKLKEIGSVKENKYSAAALLEIILKIISQNDYHSHKIVWPKKIYYELAGLMQICKQEMGKQQQSKISSF